MIASFVPATTKFRSLCSSCANVGCSTSSPSMCPTRTDATGPSNGMSDAHSAALAAIVPSVSGGFSMSTDRIVMINCVSSLYPFGNSGRIGRSVSRADSTAVVVGRPSRRKNEPGIRPAAYSRSSNSTDSGKKSIPARGFDAVAVPSSIVSP